MLSMDRYQKWVFLLLPPFYLMGFVFHLIEATYAPMLALTPYTILATAIIGFLPDILHRRRSVLVWAAATFLVTLFLEILGVATGVVFGAYDYGKTLGFQVGRVPVLIGINWTLIIMGFAALATRFTKNPWLVSLATATATVIFDWIMEPVAIGLDYWAWEGIDIPMQNYVAWFLISFVFTRIFVHCKLRTTTSVPSLIVIVQTIFFLLLRLFAI